MHSIEWKDRTLISVNSYWLEVLGYQRGEVIGRNFTDFLTPSSRRHAREVTFPEFSKTGAVRELEYQMVKKSGEVIDVLLSAAGLRGETGEITSTQTFIIDVTQRKQAERTVRELAVVEERNRLAREIHDTLAQSLISIMIQLETAERSLARQPETARVEIESAREVARRSLEEARRSVWDLHPLDGSSSLTEEIQREVKKTMEGGVSASLEVDGKEPESMDLRNELAALRIVQEALSNIAATPMPKRQWYG